MANNILLFPGTKKDTPVMTFEDAEESVVMARHYHIQETIANIAPIIFTQLDISGFELGDEESSDLMDGALIVEALRSFMCRSYGMTHPFQKIAESVFDFDKDGGMKIVDEISLSLKKED
jgi:hypothetical protein